jgi:VanZ family protein
MRDWVWRAIPAIAWMALIFALSSQDGVPQPRGLSSVMLPIVAHLALYGVLAILLLRVFQRGGRPTRSAMVAAVVAAALYGVTDEFHQSYVPGRDSSVFDLFVNTVGATIAVIVWSHVRSRLPFVFVR